MSAFNELMSGNYSTPFEGSKMVVSNMDMTTCSSKLCLTSFSNVNILWCLAAALCAAATLSMNYNFKSPLSDMMNMLLAISNTKQQNGRGYFSANQNLTCKSNGHTFGQRNVATRRYLLSGGRVKKDVGLKIEN